MLRLAVPWLGRGAASRVRRRGIRAGRVPAGRLCLLPFACLEQPVVKKTKKNRPPFGCHLPVSPGDLPESMFNAQIAEIGCLAGKWLLPEADCVALLSVGLHALSWEGGAGRGVQAEHNAPESSLQSCSFLLVN